MSLPKYKIETEIEKIEGKHRIVVIADDGDEKATAKVNALIKGINVDSDTFDLLQTMINRQMINIAEIVSMLQTPIDSCKDMEQIIMKRYRKVQSL